MTELYKNGKIYKIVNDINDEIYVGSTCDIITQRFNSHRAASRVENNGQKIYKCMREVGEEHFKIILIKLFPCNSKNELVAEEDKIMRELKASLNTNGAIRDPQKTIKLQEEAKGKRDEKMKDTEYKQQMYNKSNERRRNRSQEEKARVNEVHKKWIEDNGFDKKAYMQEYRQDEEYKEKKRETDRLYRLANKEKLAEKKKEVIRCDICGTDELKTSISRHRKSTRHLSNIKE